MYRLALVLLSIITVACAVLDRRNATPAETATATTLSTIGPQDDFFYNYDFLTENAAINNVDWAMSLLFWQGADIGRVKNILSPMWDVDPIPAEPSTMHARLNDGQFLCPDLMIPACTSGTGQYVWDDDSGKRTVRLPDCNEEANHYRVYADADDHMYDLNWGYYVIASIHKDINEGCIVQALKEFGYSEDAEYAMYQWYRDNISPDLVIYRLVYAMVGQS